MVFEAIAELVAERVEKDVSEITMESNFRDLGIDSLDTVELLMNLEDKLALRSSWTRRWRPWATWWPSLRASRHDSHAVM